MDAFKRFTYRILLAALLIGMVGLKPHNAAASASTCIQYYTVQRGDILVQIASRFNVSWRYLMEINNLSDPSRIYAGQKLCVDDSYQPDLPDAGESGRVYAVHVVEDSYVDLQGRYLPVNTRFEVIFARMSASTAKSMRVATASSDRSGNLYVTVDIPSQFVDMAQISVQLRNGSKIYAEGWFKNQNDTYDPHDDYDQINLNIQIINVVENQEVSVRINQLPARIQFDVSMADRRTQRVNWYVVGTAQSKKGGQYEGTFPIPHELWNAEQIVIRFESRSGSYSASATFNNTGGEVNDSPGLALKIVHVLQDREVTLLFTGLPAGMRFDVLMGPIGSQAEDGTLVGTIQAPAGGRMVQTYSIPANLRGAEKIAIRIQGTRPGAYAYNWFTNRTTD